MGGSPRRGYSLCLASNLVDSASARRAGQAANAEEALRALKIVAGFRLNRGAIRAVRPCRLASLSLRTIRLPLTEELATSLRNSVYQFRHSPPPAKVELAEGWRGDSRLDEAGVTHEATHKKWRQFLEHLQAMLVHEPQHPADVADGHVRLIADFARLRPLSGRLRRASRAMRDGPTVSAGAGAQLRFHFGGGSGAFTLATAVAADSVDQSASA